MALLLSTSTITIAYPQPMLQQIPILYKKQIQFDDPIAGQTLPDALPQNCSEPIENLFQMDMDQKDSWYSLTTEITHRDRTAVFAPKDISPFTTQKIPQSAKAGMYTKGHFSEFWDAILMSSASKISLQKITRNLIVPSNAKKGPELHNYYAPRTDFSVDNMISPNFLANEFVQTFGTVGYWLEKCGIWFAIFLFIKLIIDIVITVMRSLELHKNNRKIGHFWKTPTISHVKPLPGFNIELSLFTNQTHRVFDAYSCRNERIYGTNLSLYPNTTQ